MQNFRNLEVWKKSHRLTLMVYQHTGSFPKSEVYGLTSQLRRSSASVAENIAEGCGKPGDHEFARYIGIALGSLSELDYELLLAHDLGYFSETVYQDIHTQLVEIRRMLIGLHKTVRNV